MKMNRFIYLKEDVTYNDGIIKKNEVGIIDEINGTNAIVSFIHDDITIEIGVNGFEEFNPSQTGDGYNKKVCNVCNRLLNIDMFQKNQNGKNNRTVRRPSCNDCRDIIDGVGMTLTEKKQMDEIKPNMQIWTCPICKKTTIPGLTSKVVCDHNHKTGRARAWICDSCNTGLGRFKDDVNLLKNAIKYLEDNN